MSTSEAAVTVPEYRSHKRVWALKIASVEFVRTDTTTDENPIVKVTYDPSYKAAPQEFNLMGKPTPQAGWYMVRYEDGYVSFSPGAIFEANHTLINKGEAAPATVGDDITVIRLGTGHTTSNWGTYGGIPAIFLEPTGDFTGEIGSLGPEVPLDSVTPGGYVIQFHDSNGAMIVCQDIIAAIINSPSSSPVAGNKIVK